MKRVLATSFLVASFAALAGFIGWHISPLFDCPDKASLLRLEPTHLELVSSVREGEELQLPLMLSNKADTAIQVRKVAASCGCSRIVRRGYAPVASAFTIDANEMMPLQASILTEGAGGDRIIGIAVDYTINGVGHVVTSDILIHVTPGLRCAELPSVIRDTSNIDETISGSVLVGDSFSDSGVDIESVSSTAGNLVKTTFVRLPEVRTLTTNAAASEQREQFRARYKIQFSFDRRLGPFSESLVVTPTDKRRRQLQIPLEYEGCRDLPVLHPPEVLVQNQVDGDPIERIIWFTPAKPQKFKSLTLLSAPAGVEGQAAEQRSNGWRIQLTIPSSVTLEKDPVIVFADENGQPIVRIPVRMIGTRGL